MKWGIDFGYGGKGMDRKELSRAYASWSNNEWESFKKETFLLHPNAIILMRENYDDFLDCYNEGKDFNDFKAGEKMYIKGKLYEIFMVIEERDLCVVVPSYKYRNDRKEEVYNSDLRCEV